VTSEKLQNSLQKAYLPGKEVIPDFQTSQKVSKAKEKSPKYVDLGDFSCNKWSKSIFKILLADSLIPTNCGHIATVYYKHSILSFQ